MIENKTDRIRNNLNTTIKSKYGKTSSREKIIMAERKSIIINKFKKNIFKISTVLLILLIVLIYTNSNKKIVVDEYSDISELNVNKYSSEIVALYNRNDQLDKFKEEMSRVQTLVGTYVISNSTLKENSFSELIKTLNNEINNDKWVNLDSEKSKYYNGKYNIDSNGNVKFKFNNKEIEPNWINNEDISRYITLN
ncbi:MAG: hypothetical protein PHD15_04165 [Clostridia bacterium]|nr:hypothetical protein [Clostridia bacterium]MDD4386935.1 hypothetical protein [Clostridia bacterium]